MCKTKDKKIWPSKIGSAPEIHVSWQYYGDIKIRETFVYEYTPRIRVYMRACLRAYSDTPQ